MVTIINKIELEEDNNLLYTEIGYVIDQDIIDDINIQYDETLGMFLARNLTNLEKGNVDINSFFNDIPFVYEARTLINDIGDLNLIEIKNLKDL